MGGTLSGRSALVIGTGGLGGPALLALAASGVGRVVLLDDDVVETSNLNRQPLFGEATWGAARPRRPRRGSAGSTPARAWTRSTAASTPGTRRTSRPRWTCWWTAPTTSRPSSSRATAAVVARKPLVHGGVLRYTAQLLTVVPGQTGCLRCLFEEPPAPGTVPTCAEAGSSVLSPASPGR